MKLRTNTFIKAANVFGSLPDEEAQDMCGKLFSLRRRSVT